MATIDELAQDIRDLRDTNDAAHSEIISQVKTLNGRTNTLELWRARMEGAASALKVQWWIIAGVAGAAAAVGVRLLS